MSAPVPFHYRRTVQPILSDLVPDALSTTWPLGSVTAADVRGVIVVLMSGALSALAAGALSFCGSFLSERVALVAQSPNRLWLFLISPFAMMLTVLITHRCFPGAESSGISRALVAYRLVGTPPGRAPPLSLLSDIWDGGSLERLASLRVGVGKIVMHAASCASGASLGPEGPSVHLAACVAATLAKLFRAPPPFIRAAMTSGAAASIAVLFNAPLGGLLFAVEELAGEYDHFGMRSLTVVSLALALLCARLFTPALFSDALFLSAREHAASSGDWAAAAVIGALLGIAGGAFARIVIFAAMLRRRHVTRTRAALFAAFVGLAVTALNFAADGALYGGGEHISRALLDTASTNQTLSFDTSSQWYAPLKALSTLLCAASDLTGGAFVPVQSIGVGLGVHMAKICTWSSPETVLVLSLVAFFSAFSQGPMSTVAAAAEMTAMSINKVPMALMAGAVAAAVSKIVCAYPIYLYTARLGGQRAGESAAERERGREEIELAERTESGRYENGSSAESLLILSQASSASLKINVE